MECGEGAARGVDVKLAPWRRSLFAPNQEPSSTLFRNWIIHHLNIIEHASSFSTWWCGLPPCCPLPAPRSIARQFRHRSSLVDQECIGRPGLSFIYGHEEHHARRGEPEAKGE